jgi:uncharacterized OB-fold protein
MSLVSKNVARPRPVATAYSGFFWEAARHGRLLIQRCSDCRWYLHPPGPICPRCWSSNLAPVEVSGRGTLYGFSTIRHLFHPAFKNDLPYIVARVELDEQVDLVLISNLRRCAPEAARIGMPVCVIFEAVGMDVLPQFVPAECVETTQ